MEWIGLVLDLTLALIILVLAWRILHAPGIFQSIVLFITMGLVLAVVWARLHAPDIAITEAAVGAGLAGVLFLDTLRRIAMRTREHNSTPASEDFSRFGPLGFRILALAGGVGLTLLLLMAVYTLPRTAAGLTNVVQQNLEASGVVHPVTAVLLNFRVFDTFLELGVLLIAIEGLLCVRGCPGLETVAPPPRTEPVLKWLVGGLFPLMILTAGHLLLTGAFAPGGAFQAGVVLGAGLVLLWMAGHAMLSTLPRLAWRLLFGAGFGTFLVLGTAFMLQGRNFLEFPPAQAGMMILLMEAAATVSIATIMAGLFLALQPLRCEEADSSVIAGAAGPKVP
ncbi:MAG: hydrogenase subunit MbhD domain-containing protein [Desulfovibrionales bacterium]